MTVSVIKRKEEEIVAFSSFVWEKDKNLGNSSRRGGRGERTSVVSLFLQTADCTVCVQLNGMEWWENH